MRVRLADCQGSHGQKEPAQGGQNSGIEGVVGHTALVGWQDEHMVDARPLEVVAGHASPLTAVVADVIVVLQVKAFLVTKGIA